MKGKIRKIINGKTIIVAVIVVLIVMQYFQLAKISSSIDFLETRDSSLITEIGQVKDTYLAFGQDLNEVRNFLLMPTKNYLGFDDLETAEDSTDSTNDVDKNKNDVQLALFQYVDYLSVSSTNLEKLALKKSFLQDTADSTDFRSFVDSHDLTLGQINEDDYSVSLAMSDVNGESLFKYYLSKDDSVLYVKTPLDKSEVDAENTDAFQKSAIDYINKNKDSVIKSLSSLNEATASIATALISTEVQSAADNAGVIVSSEYTEADLKAVYPIKSRSGDIVAEIVLNLSTLEISLVNKRDNDSKLIVTDLAMSLPPFIAKLDTNTVIQKKVMEARENIENTISDTGFQMLLNGNNLSISKEPRFYDGRIFYDISDTDGILISSIVVEESTAVINIVNTEGTNSQNLLFFDPEFKKKTLEIPDDIPEYGDELSSDDHSFNILIAGKHGNLVDTMIFAHVDEDKKEVRMISIPRDLHYNGRKINAYGYFYGMPELKKVLSDMTGYKLDKYVLIDMYAFIDVVDLIGGIDVTLEKAVIDPTYRTVDDGVVGTLHYEPGTYHLGGKESLRLARSRHTSSDFARAERQQLILKSLQDKAKNFGFGDADTFYEIAKTVLEKTETDVDIEEAVAYYFRYQNYEILSNDVMSSGNVLYVPPYITTEQCSALIASAEAAGQPKPGCEGENHAYTLLPRDNNWNVIKWFFKEKFESV